MKSLSTKEEDAVEAVLPEQAPSVSHTTTADQRV